MYFADSIWPTCTVQVMRWPTTQRSSDTSAEYQVPLLTHTLPFWTFLLPCKDRAYIGIQDTHYWATTLIYLWNIIQWHIWAGILHNNRKNDNKNTKETMPSKVAQADNYISHTLSVKQ